MYQDTRQALQHIAWDDKDGDLLDVNLYNDRKKQMQEKHPAWFIDEEDADQAPVIKDDISSLVERLDRDWQKIDEIRKTLNSTKDDISSFAEHLDRDSQSIEEVERTVRAIKDEISTLGERLNLTTQNIEGMQQTLRALRSPDVDVQPSATKEDVLFLTTYLNRLVQNSDELQQTLRTLKGQTKWIWWLLLVALTVSIWHF
jgi:chromosome segregation ATPase